MGSKLIEPAGAQRLLSGFADNVAPGPVRILGIAAERVRAGVPQAEAAAKRRNLCRAKQFV
jgi:hypothetical protein